MLVTTKRNLEEIRTDLEMTGADLAREAGVSAATITRIEAKQNRITLVIAKKVLRALNRERARLYPDMPEITRDDVDWELM